MDWNDLRFFLAVARTSSLTKTAATLKVSQSTVSRRINALESSLRTSLFLHHQTGYFLTDAGQALLSYAEEVESRIGALEHAFAGGDGEAAGTVRLATAETLANHLIIPALPQFQADYPAIRLELITGVNTVSVVRNDADIALRLVRPEQNTLKIRKAGVMASAVYAAERYLRAHPAPEDAPLSGRRFITWDSSFSHLPAARWFDEQVEDKTSALATTSLMTQLSAVNAGLGLAVLPCFIAAQQPELIEVIPPGQVLSEDLWLVTHADLIASARIKAVAEFLMTILNRANMA
ncbi:LysR family transcriptional regulator [Kosakonia sp. CFBP8986]|jgi:DNA-binding transcriptional LysR family regulator|uniref:LysR family transcriptional regulator n=1 Tax=Kosakonia sp. CFBP8986 TaxID=3096524 RepID=UPI002A6A49FD|nr:LysR family transcriptional regulator [Kosakonia sp. CFBP8986]MDY0886851.1 LysR family transcriptional regulator [Kosakonia sp. CFBP8986]